MEFINLDNIKVGFRELKRFGYPVKVYIINEETGDDITYFYFDERMRGGKMIKAYVPCFILENKDKKRTFFSGYMGNYKAVTEAFKGKLKEGYHLIAHL